MSFKDVVKDTIKVCGVLGALVISGGFVTLTAYRRGYLDACDRAESETNEVTNEEL